MRWIYHTIEPWVIPRIAAQKVYLRAIGEETEEGLIVSNIIEANIFAMDFYFALEENPMADKKHQQIYFEELEKKDYFIEEVNFKDEYDYIMKRFTLFLKTDGFSKEELLDWLKVYLAIQGFEWSGWEEGDVSSFAETNPVLNIFSMDNVKKMEDKLGKDWWKSDDK